MHHRADVFSDFVSIGCPSCFSFFFNDTATTEIYTAQYTLPYTTLFRSRRHRRPARDPAAARRRGTSGSPRWADRKSTRLNSSHIEPSRMPSSAWKKKRDAPQPRPGALRRAQHGAARPARGASERSPRGVAAGAGGGPCMFCFSTPTAPTEIYTAQYTLSLHDALPI